MGRKSMPPLFAPCLSITHRFLGCPDRSPRGARVVRRQAGDRGVRHMAELSAAGGQRLRPQRADRPAEAARRRGARPRPAYPPSAPLPRAAAIIAASRRWLLLVLVLATCIGGG